MNRNQSSPIAYDGETGARDIGLGHEAAAALGLLLGFVLCYWQTLATLVEQWSSNDVYAHGFLIPMISGYLVWTRRADLARLPRPNHAASIGVPVLVSGLLLLVVGSAAAVVSLSQLSLPVTLAGIAIIALGPRSLLVLGFPIAYLLFMIPVWEVVTDPLHGPFQDLSAAVGTGILQAVGIPAHRDGIYIELATGTLEVARVCSGVNYLISVVAIGLALGYVALSSHLRRIALLLLTLLIGVGSNGLRIGLIGVLSHYGLAGDGHGPYHVLQGLFVSIVGYAALLGGVWLLSRGGRPGLPARVAHEVKGTIRVAPRAAAIAVSLLACTGTWLNVVHAQPRPLAADLSEIPMRVADWQGRVVEPDHPVFRTLDPDDEISRAYVRPDGAEVRVYIGYFARQTQGRELVHYTTDRLQRVSKPATLDRVPGMASLRVNRLTEQGAGRTRVTAFWYEVNGRAVADPWLVKAYTAWDALAWNGTSGTVVVVSTDQPAGQASAELPEASLEFLRDFLPVARGHLANE